MPWPKETRYLGKSTPRVEAPAKVTGRARFTADMSPPGMLYGAIFRSKWPAAHIQSINLEKARSAPGIKAAIAAKPGEFDVHFYGEELAAVAGTSRQAVLDALALIEVKAEPRPFVVAELEAVKPEAPRVFADKPNLGQGQVKETGNVDAAFAASAAVVEGFYSTPIEIHHPPRAPRPHRDVGRRRDDRLVLDAGGVRVSHHFCQQPWHSAEQGARHLRTYGRRVRLKI